MQLNAIESPKPTYLKKALLDELTPLHLLNQQEYRTILDLCQAIGNADDQLDSLDVRINKTTIPPTIYFGFIWKTDPRLDETANQRNHLRRKLHDLATLFQRHDKTPNPFANIGTTTFAQGYDQLQAIIAQRNDPTETSAVSKIRGKISNGLYRGRPRTLILMAD